MEESKFKKEYKEKTRSRFYYDESLDEESDGHVLPRFRQNFPGQSPSNTLNFNQMRVYNLKSQDDGCGILLLGCSKCDRMHEGKCLVGSNVCFGYGEFATR